MSCSRTAVKVLQFVPRGQEGYVNPHWTLEADSAFQQVEAFFAREFGGQMLVRHDVLSRYVVGREPVYRTAGPVLDEIQAVVFSPGGSYYDPVFADERTGEYTVRMIYYLNRADGQPVELPGGGAHPWRKTAINPAFWLDEVDSYGSVNSAHEMGHLLGIPHPWEMSPPRPNEPGNVMGYTTSGFTLMQCFILEEVKRAMGMK